MTGYCSVELNNPSSLCGGSKVCERFGFEILCTAFQCYHVVVVCSMESDFGSLFSRLLFLLVGWLGGWVGGWEGGGPVT